MFQKKQVKSYQVEVNKRIVAGIRYAKIGYIYYGTLRQQKKKHITGGGQPNYKKTPHQGFLFTV